MKKNPSRNTHLNKGPSKLLEAINSSIDVDQRMYKEDIEGSIAHAKMLGKQKIISKKEEIKIINGLKIILNNINKGKVKFKKSLEDIHMNIESILFQQVGKTAGKLHTARSRNDQVVTDFKLWIRNNSVGLDNHLKKLQKCLINIAKKHTLTILPGYTHLQVAQPISLAHYLLAYVEMFIRDKNRFLNNFSNLMENPLGVGAISGTSFNIDRDYTTKKLKFSLPTKNSIDTVSDRDFVVDFLYASSICSMHISRIAEELIIWNSEGFNLITLNDKVVTGSSIMPQKKNPDPLELIRGKTGSIYGNLFSMLTVLKGLPLSYFKDLQDDKKFVFDTFDQLKNSVIVLNEVLKNIFFNKKNMKILAGRVILHQLILRIIW